MPFARPHVRALSVALACALVASGCTQCATVDEHIAAGRYEDACERAFRVRAEWPAFEAWTRANTKVTATPVPVDDVTAALGGHVATYGTDTALVDVTVSVPGGTPELARPYWGQHTHALVYLMDEIPQLARAPFLEAIHPEDLVPTPPTSYASRDPISDFIDAIGWAGVGVGMAIGVAVAVPIGILAGIGAGIGGFFDAIFGGGGGRTYDPITIVEAKDVTSPESLLWTDDIAAATASLESEYAAHVARVQAEKTRREGMLANPLLLDDGCKGATCRVVLTKEDHTPYPTFSAQMHFGKCGYRVDDLVLTPLVFPVLPASEPATSAPDPMLTPLVQSREANAPSFALELPSALPVKAKGAAWLPKAQTVVDRVDDLVCDVALKRGRGDLVARLQTGRVRSRVHTAFLGKNTARAAFLAEGMQLGVGDRARITVVSRGGRSLGGAVVEFDGRVPFVLENSAFVARCGNAEIDPALVATARETALAAIADVPARPAEPTVADLEAREKKRALANAAVTRAAALAGWSRVDDVVVLLKSLEAPAVE